MASYKEKDIRVLGEIEHIQLNPGMYVGDTTDPTHLVEEALDNALDESLAGYANIIAININTKNNICSVIDNGRGIPIGNNVPITISSKLFSGAKFQDKKTGKPYSISAGLHGCGLVAVCALSESYILEIYRDKQYAKFEFKNAKLVKKEIIPFTETIPFSTKIQFKPNKKIFENLTPDLDRIRRRLTVASAELPGDKTFVLIIDDIKEIFKLNLQEYFQKYCVKANDELKTIFLKSYIKPESFNILFTYVENGHVTPKVFSSVNLLPVELGGTHVNAFYDLLREFFAIKAKKLKYSFYPQDCLVGLRAHLMLSLIEPKFSGQTKDRLTNRKIYFVEFINQLKESIETYFSNNEDHLEELLEKFQEYRRKIDSKKLKNTQTRKRGSTKFTKLRDCSSRNGELFICEGDSAGGTICQCRDPRLHAIMPLKGKVPNVVNKKDVLKNKEIGEMIYAFGTGVGSDFNIDDLRYDKIICACFSGDTKVKLLDGTLKTLEELTKQYEIDKQPIWVYSINPKNNKIEPALADNISSNREVDETVIIELENGYKIESTLDHEWIVNPDNLDDPRIIWKNGLSYIKAEDLKEDDSLRSGYLSFEGGSGYNRRYYSLTDNGSFVNLVHRYIYEYFNEKIPPHFNIHHKDENTINNIPSNIECLSNSEHAKIHNKNIINYNKSEKHKEDNKRAWQEGRMENSRQNMIEYNKTEANSISTIKLNKRDDVKIKQIIGKYARNILGFQKLGLEVNRENWNSYKPEKVGSYCFDEVLIETAKNYIIDRNLTLDDGYDLIAMTEKQIRQKETNLQQVLWKFADCCYKVIKKYGRLTFEDFEIERKKEKKCINWMLGVSLLGCSEYELDKIQNEIERLVTFRSMSEKVKLTTFVRIGKDILKNNERITKDIYQQYSMNKKYYLPPIWGDICNLLQLHNSDELEKFVLMYNMKVKSIKFKKYEIPKKMYCMRVKGNGNFMLYGGEKLGKHLNPNFNDDVNCELLVGVSNSDSDPDGGHIAALISMAIAILTPDIIKEGRYYIARTPLYAINEANNFIPLWTNEELNEAREQNKKISRFKGLGELNPKQLKACLINPETRQLIPITFSEDIEKLTNLFSNVTDKRKLLANGGLI